MGARWSLVAAAFAVASAASGAESWQAMVSMSGQVEIWRGRTRVATVSPGLFEAEWRYAGPRALGSTTPQGTARLSQIRAPGGGIVFCELRPSEEAGALRLAYKLTPRSEIRLNSLHVSMDFPIDFVAGGSYVADGERGVIPAEFGEVHLRAGEMRSLELKLRDGAEISLKFASPTQVLLQDNRRWGPSFSVRMGPQPGEARPWPAGRSAEVVFELSTKEGIAVEYDAPVTISAGPEWVPLRLELDIEPGSALDFSNMGAHDAPAGKHGWVIARPDGQFAFEKSPGTPRRFYGVNFCFSAHYIAHEESERLAERLARIGYNTVRFHHYESELVDRSTGSSTELRPDKLDQLDYLFAALKKRGIYVTTDLFVSRPVLAKEIWDDASGDVGMNDYKMLVPVNERAFENWKAFSRRLLTHVNPYTGTSYAKDPALAWLSMINEGNFGNYLNGISERTARDWQAAWNRWLAKKYGTRQALAAAWGVDPGGDPAAGGVALHRNPYDDSPRGRDLVVFLAETERDMFLRMEKFLREEIGTRALLTNMNAWTNPVQMQAARSAFGYVDDHFYVDHPQFLERDWNLPSRCDNTSPVAGGATGGRHCAFTRLLDKPFAISEYNYSGPGRFRGVGGIITGCMAALQRWGVVWRFAYSHNRGNLFAPGPAGYFDVASDPLNQAAERASICLFLRGDMRPAPHTVGIAMTLDELVKNPKRNVGVAPGWHALALVTRVGTFVAERPGAVPADIVLPLGWRAQAGAWRGGEVLEVDPYSGQAGSRILETMKAKGWLAGNSTDLRANRLQSETGELVVDAPRDVLVLNTAMTAGCYAPEGETVEAGAVTVKIEKTDATVWVSSLDGKPIASSGRLLVTHLTDLQNSGARFGERARQTLLAWGALPHLVRAGSATVTLRLRGATRARVWALSTGGRRLAEVPAELRRGELVVRLDVAGPEGARMLYEIETK